MGQSLLKQQNDELNRLYESEKVLKELLSKKPKEGIVFIRTGSYGYIYDIFGAFDEKSINSKSLDLINRMHVEQKRLVDDLNHLEKKYNDLQLKQSKRSWW